MNITITTDMKRHYSKFIIALIVAAIILTITFPTNAYKGGVGDRFSDGSECLSCHTPGQNPSLTGRYSIIVIGNSNPKIHFYVQFYMGNTQIPSQKYGIMLLTADNENLSADGWTIISDPKENPTPKNYIEMPSSNYNWLQWKLTNSFGEYAIKVLAFYGSDENEYFVESEIIINATSPFTNTPPKLTNPKANLLSGGISHFEVTYNDMNGDPPQNITVNVSGLGSFELLPKLPTQYNFTDGVTYYIITTLPEDHYSYHFSAYDGQSWNSTSNLNYFAFEEEKEVDAIPLIFGMLFASVVIFAVYTLRGKGSY